MYGAHEERENRVSSGNTGGRRKKGEGVLKPRGSTEAGGDGSVGWAQAGDAGGASDMQVRW